MLLYPERCYHGYCREPEPAPPSRPAAPAPAAPVTPTSPGSKNLLAQTLPPRQKDSDEEEEEEDWGEGTIISYEQHWFI